MGDMETDYSKLTEDQKTSLSQMAQDAILVQDGCNLSGIVFSFARAMEKLCDFSTILGQGTDWKNTHPIAVLYASKIAALTGGDDTFQFGIAYEEVKLLAKE